MPAKHDYVTLDINESDEYMRKQILELCNIEYAEGCNYCDAGKEDNSFVEAGIQMKGNYNKSEYTLIKRDLIADIN